MEADTIHATIEKHKKLTNTQRLDYSNMIDFKKKKQT